MIAIVDYGMGNPGSIRNMILRAGAECVITSDPSVIGGSDRLILPGVGAFDHAINRMKVMGLSNIIREQAVTRSKPLLGICLGLQVLCKSSEEGRLPGLGLIDADAVKFNFDGKEALRVPHMGWNNISIRKSSPLLEGMPPNPRFYFVHAYHVKCKESSDILASTEYGISFTSIVSRGNVYGVQFHPEKSHKYGLKLMQNFSRM
jgi:glutamine amidotransferase